MRTTLTIAEHIDQTLRKIARDQNRLYKDVINEALAIGAEKLEVREGRPYRVASFDAELLAGVDRARLNQLVDELESGR